VLDDADMLAESKDPKCAESNVKMQPGIPQCTKHNHVTCAGHNEFLLLFIVFLS
jgi:hypothetical protein